MTQRISDISALVTTQVHSGLIVDAATTTGLTFGFKAGILLARTPVTVAAGTVTLADDTTNFVYIQSDAVADGTSVPSDATHLLYEVVTASGVITTITDLRGVLVA